MNSICRRQVLILLALATAGAAQYDLTPVRPNNMPEIVNLEVTCAKERMTVQLGFSRPFQGVVFSKGQFNNPSCVYVQPYTSQTGFTFDIDFQRCGTKPDLNGKFYENTIIIQYDNELIEVWDEAKRLRCEWYNDYERTATKPPVVMADLEVIELNFRGDNVDCWMEIQDGKGPWASPVTGIVPIGSTLTMVIAINDPNAEFDMRVKECEASDGKSQPIYLSDKHGCVLRPKMLSKFMKQRSDDGRASVLSYAHFYAFKFPDSMYVHLRCKVEICRHGCPNHCQQAPARGYAAAGLLAAGSERETVTSIVSPLPDAVAETTPLQEAPLERVDAAQAAALQAAPPTDVKQSAPSQERYTSDSAREPQVAPVSRPQPPKRQPLHQRVDLSRIGGGLAQKLKDLVRANAAKISRSDTDGAVAGPASTGEDIKRKPTDAGLSSEELSTRSKFPYGPRSLSDGRRRRRRFVVAEEGVMSSDVGVTSILEVLSENDLQTPADAGSEEGRATIFRGQISSAPRPSRGVCLPPAGFTALFALLAVAVAVSILVAGFLYRHRNGPQCAAVHQPVSMTSIPASMASMPPSMASIPPRQWNMVGYIRQRLHVVF